MADQNEIQKLFEKLDRDAKRGGYFLNPDNDFTMELVEGLVENQRRYGYQACPCRLASGDRQEDLDLICPCDYRDADLDDFGACYCALYVSKDIAEGEGEARPVPERRPAERDERPQFRENEIGKAGSDLPFPVWRCRVCGYLTAREEPPGVCPVCKVSKDRFERFM